MRKLLMEQNFKKKLLTYARFEKKADVVKFEQLLSQVYEKNDPSYIAALMEAFDDNTQFPEVMYGIVHALENYPDEVHAKAMIEFIPFMLNHAPGWLLTLIYATFNNPSSLALFKDNIGLIPKKSMLQLLDLVAHESEHHKDLCEKLRQLVDKS